MQDHGDDLAQDLALLLKRSHDVCKGDVPNNEPSAGITGGVKVVPRKGTAILFHHDQLNGLVISGLHARCLQSGLAHLFAIFLNRIYQGDPFAWHTGCKVRGGVKWTLQKFKETPMDMRGGGAAKK